MGAGLWLDMYIHHNIPRPVSLRGLMLAMGTVPNWALILIVSLVAVVIRGALIWVPVLILDIFLSFTLSMGLKAVIHIPRPPDAPPLPWITTCSFPSAHSAVAFSVLPTLFDLYGASAWPFAALAFFVAYSRLYLRVHWFTDIIAGAVIGLIVGWSIYEAAPIIHDLALFKWF